MSIFKQPLASGVDGQIDARQKSVGTRNTNTIKWLQSRQAWVKMTSAVDVNGNNTLASQYILSGNSPSTRYSISTPSGGSNKLGNRPKPGITSVEVKTKGAYGSLREATVQFQCWDVNQLSDLEQLYMRPGYTVLLEWGWFPYLDNSQNLQKGFPLGNINLLSPQSKEDVIKKIINTSSVNGNYDGLYGYIKNYNWSLRDDGGYDCSTTIISTNEVVESLKINQGGFIRDDSNSVGILGSSYAKGDFIDQSYSKNLLAGIMAEITTDVLNQVAPKWYEAVFAAFSDTVTMTTSVGGYNILVVELEIENPPAANDDSPFSEGFQTYIRLHDLVEILNTHIILKDGNSPYTAVDLFEGFHQSSGTPLYCSADHYQLSVDPLVCQIRNQAWIGGAPPISVLGGSTSISKIQTIMSTIPEDYVQPSSGTYPPYEVAEIGNIYIHTGYIYNLITDMDVAGEDEKEKNDISLFDFLKKLMNGINTAIGNVANFEIFADPTDSRVRIIDASYVAPLIPPSTTTEIQLLNNRSIVRKYTFESKIFSEQSTIVAIGAQTEGGALASDTNTLVEFNKGLKDRIIPEKKEPAEKGKTKSAKQTNLENAFENIGQFFIDLEPNWIFEATGEFDASNASKYSNALKDIIQYRKANSSKYTSNAKKKDIIPTTLNLDIDGIGGIIIGNIIDINQDVLPKGYADPRIGYVITGVSHTIQDNDWKTSLQTQFIIK